MEIIFWGKCISEHKVVMALSYENIFYKGKLLAYFSYRETNKSTIKPLFK
jgi:hypothetical protein